MTRSEIWTICGHRLQLDVTLEQEALGTSAQVCQITGVSQNGQSLPTGYSWVSGIHQTTLDVRGDGCFNRGEKANWPDTQSWEYVPCLSLGEIWFPFVILGKFTEQSLQLDASVQCMPHSYIKERTLNCLDVSLCLMSGRFKALCERQGYFAQRSVDCCLWGWFVGACRG